MDGPRPPAQPPLFPPASRGPLALTVALLALGLADVPESWAAVRSVVRAMRSTELNRAEREAGAGGYYEGLIGIGSGPAGRSELSRLLLGRPGDLVKFAEADAVDKLEDDPLQFELKPGIDRTVFGRHFTTNTHGMRDRPYARAKPPGVVRIALLGSSMDMGWGVGTRETYENLLEDWLNARAARLGLARRFEVLNFAVAAYSPLHRLETFRRKAVAFDPDLVLYSATRLDPRLLEIHLCNLLADEIAPPDAFCTRTFAAAGLGVDEVRRALHSGHRAKDPVKARLRPHLWPLIDQSLAALDAECRSRDLPLACLVVPRASESDAPAARADDLARLRQVADRLAVPLLDLSPAFDAHDPSSLEIASWDDHPNALGHKLLFRALARALLDTPGFAPLLFPDLPARAAGPGPAPDRGTPPDGR